MTGTIQWEPAIYQHASNARMADWRGMRLYVYRTNKGAHTFTGIIDGHFVGHWDTIETAMSQVAKFARQHPKAGFGMGTQPDPDAAALVSQAAEAQEMFGDDELERHAAELRRKTAPQHTPGPLVMVAESLNAIADNAHAWTPSCIATHAQMLRVLADQACEQHDALLAALQEAAETLTNIANAIVSKSPLDDLDALVAARSATAAIAKATVRS